MTNQKTLELVHCPEQLWNYTCNKQGWNDDSKIIHLEGFIRDKGLFAEFSAYAEKSATEENAESDGSETLDFDGVIDAIKKTLFSLNGALLESTHNRLCFCTVSYASDSMFKQDSDGEPLNFADVIKNIEEVLIDSSGKILAQTYNQICSNEIEYLGDSSFKKIICYQAE